MVRARAVRHVMMIRAKIAQLAKLAAAFAVSLACTLPARADSESGWGLLNMTPGVTEISRNIYASAHGDLLDLRGHRGHRLRRDDLLDHHLPEIEGRGADVTLVHNTKVELIWTAVPVTDPGLHGDPGGEDAGRDRGHHQDRADIKVTGFQWGWQYDYLDNGVAVLLAPRPQERRARASSSPASTRTRSITTC